MRVYNQQSDNALSSQIITALENYRKQRHFDPQYYLQAKSKLLQEYFLAHGLDTAVLGISGGVDSAVVLALLNHCQQNASSPLRQIIPLSMPVHDQRGATNQKQATDKGKLLSSHLGLEANIIDLTTVHKTMMETVAQGLGRSAQPWANGQLVSYLRTPALYYTTSLLTEAGQAAVVCGTINRDEGAYLGYLGKAGDGMVDLQLIADLHKSEVYRLADYLRLPEEILKSVPNGDMFDGRTDEQVFGASYDFVEFYMYWLNLTVGEKAQMQSDWSEQTKEQFKTFAANLEKVHNHNKHKYLAGSPAVHLNVYLSAVKGGWQK